MHFREDFTLTLSSVPYLRLLGWMKTQYTTALFQILLPIRNWELGGGASRVLSSVRVIIFVKK